MTSLKLFAHYYGRNFNFTTECPNPAAVGVYPVRLGVSNLADSSVKFVPPYSVVKVYVLLRYT